MVKHSESNNKGFTLLEMLVVVAIIAILIALAYGLFKDQVIKAKVATDASNVRNAKALAITEHLEHKKNAVYVYDANQGSVLVKDEDDISGVEGYGQTPYSYSKSLATNQIQEETYGAIGHPISDSGTKNFVCVRIAKGEPVRCYWSSGKCSNVPSVPKDDDHGGGSIPSKPDKPVEPILTPGTWEHFNKFNVLYLEKGQSYSVSTNTVVYNEDRDEYFIYTGNKNISTDDWNLDLTQKACEQRRIFNKDDLGGWDGRKIKGAKYGDIYWDGTSYRKIIDLSNYELCTLIPSI